MPQPGEQDGRAVGPLPAGGIIRFAALLGLDLAQTLEPLRAGAQAEKARSLKCVRLSDAKGDESQETGKEQAKRNA